MVANQWKRYRASDDVIFIHTCDMIFDQSVRSVFVRRQALVLVNVIQINNWLWAYVVKFKPQFLK